jgi:hypothetical protein
MAGAAQPISKRVARAKLRQGMLPIFGEEDEGCVNHAIQAFKITAAWL